MGTFQNQANALLGTAAAAAYMGKQSLNKTQDVIASEVNENLDHNAKVSEEAIKASEKNIDEMVDTAVESARVNYAIKNSGITSTEDADEIAELLGEKKPTDLVKKMSDLQGRQKSLEELKAKQEAKLAQLRGMREHNDSIVGILKNKRKLPDITAENRIYEMLSGNYQEAIKKGVK